MLIEGYDRSDWDWIGTGFGLDWDWIGIGLGLDWIGLDGLIACPTQGYREFQMANEMEAGFDRFLRFGPLRKLSFYNPKFFSVFE